MLRSSPIRIALIAGSALAVATLPGFACILPAPVMSLWDGTHEAELIVVGKIVEINVNEIALGIDQAGRVAEALLRRMGALVSVPEVAPPAAVTLDISATLKGKTQSRVSFRIEGVTSTDTSSITHSAIYFLQRENGEWRWSSMPLYFDDPAELAALRTAITDAVALGPYATPAEALDWHVGIAAQASIRGLALNALEAYKPLPEATLRRLAEAFVADPGPEGLVPQMLKLLAEAHSPEVARIAAAIVAR